MKLHKQLMNVKEYILDVVSSIAAEAREKGITIDFKCGFRDEINGNANNTSRKGSINSRKSNLSLRLLDMVGKNQSNLSINSGRSNEKKSGTKDVFKNDFN